MSKFTSDDIQSHIREEIKRRPPKDEEKIREKKRIREELRELLRGSWKDMEMRLKEVGVRPGSQDYVEARNLWNQVHRDLTKERCDC